MASLNLIDLTEEERKRRKSLLARLAQEHSDQSGSPDSAQDSEAVVEVRMPGSDPL